MGALNTKIIYRFLGITAVLNGLFIKSAAPSLSDSAHVLSSSSVVKTITGEISVTAKTIEGAV